MKKLGGIGLTIISVIGFYLLIGFVVEIVQIILQTDQGDSSIWVQLFDSDLYIQASLGSPFWMADLFQQIYPACQKSHFCQQYVDPFLDCFKKH